MHYFEKEYQRRFKNAEGIEGIDQDQLWENISTEMDQQDRRRFLLWWPILLLLGAILGGGYFLFNNSVTEIEKQPNEHVFASQDVEKPSTITEGVSGSQSEGNIESSAEIVDQESAQLEKVPMLSEQVTEHVFVSQDVEKTSTTTEDVSGSQSEGNIESSAEIVDQESAQLEKTPMVSDLQEDLSQETNEISTSAEVFIEENENQKPTAGEDTSQAQYVKADEQPSKPPRTENQMSVALIKQLPIKAFYPELSETEQPGLPAITLPSSKNYTESKTIQLGALVTALNWQDRYQNQGDVSDYVAELTTAHKVKSGYAVGVQFEKKLNERWRLATGLQFQQLYSSFEWNRTWDTVMYRNNVPGADIIDARGTRIVKHQNEIKALHLPILIGYEGGQSKWRLGTQVGLGLNLMLQQSGKTLLDESTVMAFDQKNTGPYDRLFLNGQIVSYLAYQFNERTQLRLTGQVRYQWHGTSDIYEFKQNSLLWGVGIGFLYHL